MFRKGRRPTSLLATLFVSVSLIACESDPNEDLVTGPVEGFAGVVAADEPRAAVIGREVLGNGGTAADAAIAMYFAMTVTLPSRVSLAGGGVCLVLDSRDLKANLVQFLPAAGPTGGVLPLAPRAMAALHARHGRLRWSAVVVPAEGLARFGHDVSRAFARDLAAGRQIVAADPYLRRTFRNRSGGLPQEGDRIEQVELSGVLSGLRSRKAGYFYSGEFARRYAEASTEAGQEITVEQLWTAVPTAQTPAMVRLDRKELYFSLPPADNGLMAAELWEILTELEDYEDENLQDRAHLFAEAAMRSFADRDRWRAQNGAAPPNPNEILDEDHLELVMQGYDPDRHTPAESLPFPPRLVAEDVHGASLVAGDRFGNAAACSFTMNGLFGAGRTAPGTGIILSAPPGPDSNGGLSPTVAVYGNTESGEGYSAVAASGGAAASTALVQVLHDLLIDEVPPKEAVSAPRLHHGGAPDVVLYEPGVSEDVRRALEARGHRIQAEEKLGRVNAFHCPRGLPEDDHGCRVASDPRGHGLAVVAQ